MALPKTHKLLDELIRDLETSLGLPSSKDVKNVKSESAPADKKADTAAKQVGLQIAVVISARVDACASELRAEEGPRT